MIPVACVQQLSEIVRSKLRPHPPACGKGRADPADTGTRTHTSRKGCVMLLTRHSLTYSRVIHLPLTLVLCNTRPVAGDLHLGSELESEPNLILDKSSYRE